MRHPGDVEGTTHAGKYGFLPTNVRENVSNELIRCYYARFVATALLFLIRHHTFHARFLPRYFKVVE